MKIGFARAPITPSLDRPVFRAGFARNRRATAVHDDVEVRALSLAHGQQTVALVAPDLIGFMATADNDLQRSLPPGGCHRRQHAHHRRLRRRIAPDR